MDTATSLCCLYFDGFDAGPWRGEWGSEEGIRRRVDELVYIADIGGALEATNAVMYPLDAFPEFTVQMFVLPSIGNNRHRGSDGHHGQQPYGCSFSPRHHTLDPWGFLLLQDLQL